MKLLIETIVVGISIIIFGSLMSFVAGLFLKLNYHQFVKIGIKTMLWKLHYF